MFNLKRIGFFVAAAGALTFAPVAPASAVVPWLLGRHVLEALVGLATLPLALAATGTATPAAPYPATPPYGASAYYAPPAYYPRAPYYPSAPAYYPGSRFYRPAVSYAHPVQRFYGAQRGYYAPSARYTRAYGAHAPYQSGRFTYRHR